MHPDFLLPPTGIRIELEHPAKSFLPGELLRGRVVLENEKCVEATELKLKLEGKGKVSWPERVTRKGSTGQGQVAAVFFTSEVVYLQEEVIFLGSSSGETRFRISRGRTVFPFQFLLPKSLPPSFVSQVGNVSYRLEVTLELPWRRSDATFLLPFTVDNCLDLNMEPRAGLPYQRKKFRPMRSWLTCMNGPTGFVFRMKKTGFVPGEVVEFLVELSNRSSRSTYWMKVVLVQIFTFCADGGKSKVVEYPVREVKGPKVCPGECEIWVEDNALRIPEMVPPTSLASERMINVHYQLKLTMSSNTKQLKITQEVPITIGTIPFRESFSSPSMSSTSSSSSSIRKPSISSSSSTSTSLSSSDQSFIGDEEIIKSNKSVQSVLIEL